MTVNDNQRRPRRRSQPTREPAGNGFDDWLDDDAFTDDDLGMDAQPPKRSSRPRQQPRPPRPTSSGMRATGTTAGNTPVERPTRKRTPASTARNEHNVNSGYTERTVNNARAARKRTPVNNGRTARNGSNEYSEHTVDSARSGRSVNSGRKRAGADSVNRARGERTGSGGVRRDARRSDGARRSDDVQQRRSASRRNGRGRGANGRANGRSDGMYTLASGRVVPANSIIDDPWELVDENGVFRDGPGVPRLRCYPTGLDELIVERDGERNGKTVKRHLHCMTFEEFSPLMGTSKVAQEKTRRDIYEQPYDDAGYLRVFLLSKGMGRVFELGSEGGAASFASGMETLLDQYMNENTDVSYRSGSSEDYRAPEWKKH